MGPTMTEREKLEHDVWQTLSMYDVPIVKEALQCAARANAGVYAYMYNSEWHTGKLGPDD